MAYSSLACRRRSEKLLQQVLATADLRERTRLIGEAVSWHLKAVAAADTSPEKARR